jgi:hypothetical protein
MPGVCQEKAMLQLPLDEAPANQSNAQAHAEAAGPPPFIQMLHIMTGHWVGQAAAAIARFEIPDHLAGGPRPVADLARLTGADADALHRLLRAGASVGILAETAPATYATTPLGETLRKGAPGSLRDLVVAELATGHWLPWGHLYEAVKTGASQAEPALGCTIWDYYGKHQEEGACFARGMSNLSAAVVGDVVAACDFAPFSRIVDVGGSEGVMLAGALRAAPAATGVLFDLPEVIARGRAAVERHGLGGRLESVTGDFFKEVPAGGDLYILKSVLHDWDDEKSVAILRNVHQAARPGARIVVVEMVLPERVTPSPVHLMDLNMLVMLGGRERTEKQFAALLAAAGLRYERAIATRGLFSVLEATRP